MLYFLHQLRSLKDLSIFVFLRLECKDNQEWCTYQPDCTIPQVAKNCPNYCKKCIYTGKSCKLIRWNQKCNCWWGCNFDYFIYFIWGTQTYEVNLTKSVFLKSKVKWCEDCKSRMEIDNISMLKDETPKEFDDEEIEGYMPIRKVTLDYLWNFCL